MMDVDNRRLGVVLVGIGVVLLLTLRLWASPVALAVTGRTRIGVVSLLAVPIMLAVIGFGIAIALWGEELGLE